MNSDLSYVKTIFVSNLLIPGSIWNPFLLILFIFFIPTIAYKFLGVIFTPSSSCEEPNSHSFWFDPFLSVRMLTSYTFWNSFIITVHLLFANYIILLTIFRNYLTKVYRDFKLQIKKYITTKIFFQTKQKWLKYRLVLIYDKTFWISSYEL